MQGSRRIEGACRLLDRGVIRVVGADAATFLQGQLTNDVASLDSGSARLAAFCSAKGRMQASFVVWRDRAGAGDAAGAEAVDTFFLACSRDLLAPTLKRLSMFVLRAKCRLDDASDAVALWGLAGRAAGSGTAASWSRDGATMRLPDAIDSSGARTPRVLHAAAADAPPPAGDAMSLDDWNALEVGSGVATVVAATVDRFVPQMVNFELVGGVDFGKGCYPGQEVVARSQYRGTLKRRAFLYAVDDATARAGDDVCAASAVGEPVGTVVNGAPVPGGPGAIALVELRLAALDEPLCLRSPDGPTLHRLPMPYDVPTAG